jgi:NAD(P)-dependent dehydrogenase (short-subunit alcohol dehydrogenase family)
MEELVSRALNRYGRLDVMICNAGFGVAGHIEAVPARHMRKLLDVNYLTITAEHAEHAENVFPLRALRSLRLL